jgi:hypothetical protein
LIEKDEMFKGENFRWAGAAAAGPEGDMIDSRNAG